MGLTVKKKVAPPGQAKKSPPQGKKATPVKQKSPARKGAGASKVTVPSMGGMAPAKELDYQAEDDVRTLMRAEAIKKDPQRLRRAQAVARKQAEAASKVAGA